MPTIKHKIAFKEVVNGSTLTDAMKVAKYSPSAVKRTNKLTRTKGWQELMEKELPDGLLAKKHRELLEVPRKIRHFKKGDLESEYEELDSNAIKSGLDMAYKLKGKYAAEKHEVKQLVVEISKEIAEKNGINS